MERKGQVLLVVGILMTLLSMLLTREFFPDRKWIFILSDFLLLGSVVLVVWGFILVVRSKFSKQKK